MPIKIRFKGKAYDNRYGGPFERGRHDSFNQNMRNPHYFADVAYVGKEIYPRYGSDEWNDYMAGYAYNDKNGVKREYPELTYDEMVKITQEYDRNKAFFDSYNGSFSY